MPVLAFSPAYEDEVRQAIFRIGGGEGGTVLSRYFGLGVLEDAGYSLFVEGDTDFATCDYHGYPVQGIPGATIWKPEWKRYYKDVPKHYVWKEPGAAGEGAGCSLKSPV